MCAVKPKRSRNGPVRAPDIVVAPTRVKGATSNGIDVAFDLGVLLSSPGGLSFTGAAGLQTVRPVHVALGPLLSVDAVELSLLARDGRLTPRTRRGAR